MMKAELTAENRPACVILGSAPSTEYENKTTHEDKGCIQVFVVFARVISVKLFRFPPVDGEEVGP